MNFMSEEKILRYYKVLELGSVDHADVERMALFFILTQNDDLYRKIEHIYNFSNKTIHLNCLKDKKVDFSTGSLNLIKLAFNLFNGTPADIHETFVSLDDDNKLIARHSISIRYGIPINRKLINELEH